MCCSQKHVISTVAFICHVLPPARSNPDAWLLTVSFCFEGPCLRQSTAAVFLYVKSKLLRKSRANCQHISWSSSKNSDGAKAQLL